MHAGADDLLSRPIVLVVALAIVSLLPFAFMTVTAFVKIATVLQIVRSAIGAQNVPSSGVIMALAAALTLIAMAPVGDRIVARASPLFAGKEIPDSVAMVERGIDAVREPMRDFLKNNASDTEKGRFLDVARSARTPEERASVGADDLTVLVPAFVVTELTEAFAIGFPGVLAFPGHRSRGVQRAARPGDADDEPDPGELALQAAAVRGHRRLGPARALARQRIPLRRRARRGRGKEPCLTSGALQVCSAPRRLGQ
jgi:type III secretory pathway component EscR